MHKHYGRLIAASLLLAAPLLAQPVNFNAPRTFGYFLTGVYSVSVADFNGDGKPDLAVGSDNSIEILLGNGDGTFQALTPLAVPGAWLATADFNGDGKPDLAFAGGYADNI